MSQDFEIAFQLMMVGMTVVVCALVLLALLIYLMTWLDSRWQRREVPAPAASSSNTPDDTHLVAVLTAAATVALTRPVRVQRFRRIDDDTAWIRGGRLGVTSRHQPRR